MTRLLALITVLAAGVALAQGPGTYMVVGRVYWPGHDLSSAQIRVFRDPQHKDLVQAFPAMKADGRVLLALPPGTYYPMAVVDLNGDGKFSAGDGLGFYGVVDPHTSRPQPLVVKASTFTFDIVISLVMGPHNQLRATGVKAPQPAPAPQMISLKGQLSHLGSQGAAVVYLVPKNGGDCQAYVVDPAQKQFNFRLPAGVYYLFAVQDANGDERADAGDLVAAAGYSAAMGRTFPSLEFKADRDDLSLTLAWRIGEKGQLQAVAGHDQGPKMDLATLPAVVYGRAVAPDKTAASHLLVRAFTDAALHEEAAKVFSPGDQFALALSPGIYFLSVVADTDGNGKATAGDLVGFFGVSDLRRSHGPQPLLLQPAEIRCEDLPLTAQLGPDLRPTPLAQPDK